MSEIFLHRGAGTAYLRPGATEASLDAWNVPAGAISLPREMTDRLIAIRSEHADKFPEMSLSISPHRLVSL